MTGRCLYIRLGIFDFKSNAKFCGSSKIVKLKSYYSDLLVYVLNRYFGSGLGSRHTLIVGELAEGGSVAVAVGVCDWRHVKCDM